MTIYDENNECDACGHEDCDYANECTYCGDWTCEEWSDNECRSCGRSFYTGDSEGISDYSYKPDPIFHGTEGPHFGIELEIGTEGSDANAIYDWARANDCRDLFYCKEDGSVETGFEIVSHPMSVSFFDSIDWDSFMSMLADEYGEYWGKDENSEHGLHVHVSRTAFKKQSDLARLAYMITRHQYTVEEIARRSGSHWARFAQYPVSQLLPFKQVIRAKTLNIWDDECGRYWEFERPAQSRDPRRQTQSLMRDEHRLPRHSAINFLPRDTIEFRVFRSTRRAEDLRMTFHFVAAISEFVRTVQPCTATLPHSVSFVAFASFVRSHSTFSYDTKLVTALEGY